MDYNSIHGPGISNFSSSSPRKPPTISATQAIQELQASPTRCISTGLKNLDAILQNRDPTSIPEGEPFYGGVSKGKVTEIYGPPGAGKTALGMQLASSALHKGVGVIWIDASHPLPGRRFSQILDCFQPIIQTTEPSSDPPKHHDALDPISNLTNFFTPTLAHLIALLCNQTPTHPEPKTGLIIINSFSSLISNAFSRSSNSNNMPKKPGAPNPSARKFPILQYLINSLHKLAATRNIAIVVISQCVTKMRHGAGAVLVPTVNTPAWEQGLGCRVALYRDWGWSDDDGNSVTDVRLAEVLKAEGIAAAAGWARVAGFSISDSGLRLLTLPVISTLASPQKMSPNRQMNTFDTTTLPRPVKRKIAETDLEIPDSDAEDDEDYGWAEDDEDEIPAMPPQWQGSEDILVAPVIDEEPAEDEELQDSHPDGFPVEIADSEDELGL